MVGAGQLYFLLNCFFLFYFRFRVSIPKIKFAFVHYFSFGIFPSLLVSQSVPYFLIPNLRVTCINTMSHSG
jgi:hypothetical protein